MAEMSVGVDCALVSCIASFLRGIEQGADEKVVRMRLSHQFLRDVWLHERPRPDVARGQEQELGDSIQWTMARSWFWLAWRP